MSGVRYVCDKDSMWDQFGWIKYEDKYYQPVNNYIRSTGTISYFGSNYTPIKINEFDLKKAQEDWEKGSSYRGWIKYCPQCENEKARTTCSACGCGHCIECGYRFSCYGGALIKKEGEYWDKKLKEKNK